MYKFNIDDKPGLDKFGTEITTTPARTSGGRFPKGNKEGHRFQKGHSGPRVQRTGRPLSSGSSAHDVLYLDHETGRQMTYHQLCAWIKRKADTSPRILNSLLDHALGKPPEQIQQEQVFFIINGPKDTKAQDAEVIDGDQKSLPEGKKE